MVNMQIGLVGKPNVGKSTFFSALTMHDVPIANYPFTTISANRGVGYVRKPCPHTILGKPCNPKNSICQNDVRYIPVELIDVAGLVPNAHLGKGLGNKFLDDLRNAKALIHIVDISGSTDFEGNTVDLGSHNPMDDISFLENEISYWIKDIIEYNFKKIARKIESENIKVETVIYEQLTGLGISENEVIRAVKDSYLENPTKWKDEDFLRLSKNILHISKPILIAANKADKTPEEFIKNFKNSDYKIIPTSADYELALLKAKKAGLIEYYPGAKDFKILKPDALTDQQKKALDKISEYMDRFGGTGVQSVLEYTTFNLLDLISVYPVEDESKWCDKNGNVLPDVYLVKNGATAIDLAYKVHTDLGENFIRGIDAKTKKIIGSDHILKDGDVIKIVAKT
jgi:ribosome-binding ATPase YchF (GTP1/OBG family)